MKKNEPEDRRQLARWKASGFFQNGKKYDKPYFDVIDRTSDQSIGHLEDLTQEGFRIKAHGEIMVNETFALRIEFPSKIKGMKDITTEAECLWCRIDIDTGQFSAGFKIAAISPPFIEIVGILTDSENEICEETINVGQKKKRT